MASAINPLTGWYNGYSKPFVPPNTPNAVQGWVGSAYGWYIPTPSNASATYTTSHPIDNLLANSSEPDTGFTNPVQGNDVNGVKTSSQGVQPAYLNAVAASLAGGTAAADASSRNTLIIVGGVGILLFAGAIWAVGRRL